MTTTTNKAAPMTTSTFSTPTPEVYLTALDLCCGCGMASYGLTQAGVDIAGAWDIWENALETYALNVSQDDALENWSIESALPWGDEARGRADIVIMGPPCQDDSRANHRSVDKGRGELKHPALDRALEAGARWIVMEMVSKKYVPWATEKGARQIIRLNDHELGGFTGRTRWFAVWGPADLEIAKLPKSERKGWGDAFPHHDFEGAVLTTEAHSKAKRWKHARTPDQPAHAVAGQGVAHVVRYADGEEVRLGPQEAAMLSGLPSSWQFADDQWISGGGADGRLVRFGARNFREAQTMIGNGWPVSFGKAVGEAIIAAEVELQGEPEPTPEPADEPDQVEPEAPRRTVLSYGLGVDSTAILLRWLTDPASRPCDLADLIVITAHVGDEFASTLELVERHVLPLLREHGIRFVQLGRKGKTGLKVLDDSREPARLYADHSFKVSDEYRSGGTIPQTAGDRKCSMRAKGEIIDAWLLAELGDQVFDHVIGFEANEPGRAKRDATFTRELVGPKKAARMPNRAPSYPLITWGWDRQRCIDEIAELVGVVWPKSACTFCPFSCGKAEVMARFEAEPEAAHLALELEALALALNPRAKLYKRHSAREKMAAAGLDAILAEHGRRLDAATWALYSVTRVFTPSGGAVRKLEVLQTGTREAVSLALSDAAARDGLAVQLDDDGFRRAWASHRRTVTERVKSGKGTRKRERTLPCVESYLVAGLAGAEPKTNAAFDTYLGRQLEAEKAAA
jgi:site-specific DNA-cytosine methylase